MLGKRRQPRISARFSRTRAIIHADRRQIWLVAVCAFARIPKIVTVGVTTTDSGPVNFTTVSRKLQNVNSMSSKTVLSIGQCRPDQAAITHFLTSNFPVKVVATDLPDESLKLMQDSPVDLVLINRKLDADYSDGMEILRSIKSNPDLAATPVMLVSNFEDWQEKAIESGALRGFGKAELSSPQTIQRVGAALSLPAD